MRDCCGRRSRLRRWGAASSGRGGVPRGALRRVRPAGEVLEGRVVGRDQAGARAAFDRHVADRHALFHARARGWRCRCIRRRSRCRRRCRSRDQRENDVLGRDAGLQRAIHAHLEGLRLALQQALRGQHVLHFAGADAEGQRAERAVRGGVAVAADHGHAGLRESQFRADHVDDALPVAVHAQAADAELAAVGFQLRELLGGDLIDDRQRAVRWWECCGPRWRW